MKRMLLAGGLLVALAASAQSDSDHRWSQPGDTDRQVWGEPSPARKSWSGQPGDWNAGAGTTGGADRNGSDRGSWGGDHPRPEAPPDGYRFRGDPESRQGDWQTPSGESQYRFRPLSETDQGRMRPPTDGHPLDSRHETGRQPDLFDSMQSPNRRPGGDPNAWPER
jgi:hypothetical protein